MPNGGDEIVVQKNFPELLAEADRTELKKEEVRRLSEQAKIFERVFEPK